MTTRRILGISILTGLFTVLFSVSVVEIGFSLGLILWIGLTLFILALAISLKLLDE